MVNRVFCYSQDVAKKNRNNLPISLLILFTIIFIAAIALLIILLRNYMILFVIIMILLIIIIYYYSYNYCSGTRPEMTGWATTNDGRIFKVIALNNGRGLYYSGYATGDLVDELIGINSNIGRNLGKLVGAQVEIYIMKKTMKYMSNPDNIAKIVEKAPNVPGVKVFEILKVHSITDRKHTVKLNCDYRIIGTEKIKYNKKMLVEKSYNQFNDLVNIINTHR